MQSTLGEFQESQSQEAFNLQNSKLLKVRLDAVTIQAKLGSMVAYQGDVSFEHSGSGGLGRMLKKAVSGEGTQLMKMTGRVRDMIMDPEQTGQLHEVISEGAYYGMQTFDQALLEHVQQGRVTMEDALSAATSPHDFKLLAASGGQRSTSVDQLMTA